MSAEAKPVETRQWVPLKCDCGAKTGAYLNHYDICRCVCGRNYWALRPVHKGPLVAFYWPGNYHTGRLTGGLSR
jgi:hypothetical protein